MAKQTVEEIKKAVRNGRLPEQFTPKQVNAALRIDWGGAFLPKHRVGNPRNETEHFVRIRTGLYRLK